MITSASRIIAIYLLAGFKALRAATKSRCQAFASFSGRSTFLNASANSGPVEPFLLSGTEADFWYAVLEEDVVYILIMDAVHAVGEIAGGLIMTEIVVVFIKSDYLTYTRRRKQRMSVLSDNHRGHGEHRVKPESQGARVCG